MLWKLSLLDVSLHIFYVFPVDSEKKAKQSSITYLSVLHGITVNSIVQLFVLIAMTCSRVFNVTVSNNKSSID